MPEARSYQPMPIALRSCRSDEGHEGREEEQREQEGEDDGKGEQSAELDEECNFACHKTQSRQEG